MVLVPLQTVVVPLIEATGQVKRPAQVFVGVPGIPESKTVENSDVFPEEDCAVAEISPLKPEPLSVQEVLKAVTLPR